MHRARTCPQEVGEVHGPWGGGAELGALLLYWRNWQCEQCLEVRWHFVDHVDGHNGFQRGASAQGEEGVRFTVEDNRNLRSVVVELWLELVCSVERVVFDDDRAQPQDRRDCDDVLRAVGERNRHAVPRLDAEFGQAGCRAADVIVELGVGELLAHEPCCGAARLGGHGPVEPAHERICADFGTRVRPFGVLLNPGLCVCGAHCILSVMVMCN